MASLVVQTSFLGDVVLTTPLLRELASRGPVDVVVTPAAAPLLANLPDAREVIVYDKRGADRGAGGMLRLARRLSRGGYGAAYLAQGSTRSAALAAAAGIGRRVGFATSGGRLLYTHRVPYLDDRHHAERLWRLAFPDGGPAEVEPERIRPRLEPGGAERAAVDDLLHGHDPALPLVALAPGSVWATKRWPGYPDLARRLAAGVGARLVVVGAAADRELAAEIAAAVAGVPGSAPAIDATGRLSLLGSAELIRRARALVTNDSAPQHLASAVGTPTVALFGPTVPAFGFGPLAPCSTTVGHEGLACRPCDRHGPRRCPLGHWRCMTELDAGLVASQVALLMANSTH